MLSKSNLDALSAVLCVVHSMLLADCALLPISSHCDACILLVAPLFSAVWLQCTLALGQECLLGLRLHADLFHTKLACLLTSTHGSMQYVLPSGWQG